MARQLTDEERAAELEMAGEAAAKPWQIDILEVRHGLHGTQPFVDVRYRILDETGAPVKFTQGVNRPDENGVLVQVMEELEETGFRWTGAGIPNRATMEAILVDQARTIRRSLMVRDRVETLTDPRVKIDVT